MPPMTDVHRYQKGRALVFAADEVAEEEPLEIRIRGHAVSVTLRTPGHDEELAAGFLLSEGLIAGKSDITRLEPCAHDRMGNIINAILSPTVEVDFNRLTRHVFASSSCGLCGKATIDAICGRVYPVESSLRIDVACLLKMPDQLRAAQPTFDRTGGLHGAAIFTSDGQLVAAREDVGRHNAVDKVLGHALLNGLLPLDRHVLMVSGRLSFEIMQKSLCARVPIIAAVSAPSSLAVDFARESGQTLIGFLRSGRMNIYSGLSRVSGTDS